MEKPESYSNYPLWIIVVSNIVSLATYLAGAYIIYQFGLLWLGLYIIYVLFFVELRILRKSCVNCYYYGKNCAFGRGRICSLLFSKGVRKPSKNPVTWKNILPDFLVAIIPIIAGIFILITSFSWAILVLTILLLVLMTAGNGFVRGSLACKHCMQRKTCPALKLFEKK